MWASRRSRQDTRGRKSRRKNPSKHRVQSRRQDGERLPRSTARRPAIRNRVRRPLRRHEQKENVSSVSATVGHKRPRSTRPGKKRSRKKRRRLRKSETTPGSVSVSQFRPLSDSDSENEDRTVSRAAGLGVPAGISTVMPVKIGSSKTGRATKGRGAPARKRRKAVASTVPPMVPVPVPVRKRDQRVVLEKSKAIPRTAPSSRIGGVRPGRDVVNEARASRMGEIGKPPAALQPPTEKPPPAAVPVISVPIPIPVPVAAPSEPSEVVTSTSRPMGESVSESDSVPTPASAVPQAPAQSRSSRVVVPAPRDVIASLAASSTPKGSEGATSERSAKNIKNKKKRKLRRTKNRSGRIEGDGTDVDADADGEQDDGEGRFVVVPTPRFGTRVRSRRVSGVGVDSLSGGVEKLLSDRRCYAFLYSVAKEENEVLRQETLKTAAGLQRRNRLILRLRDRHSRQQQENKTETQNLMFQIELLKQQLGESEDRYAKERDRRKKIKRKSKTKTKTKKKMKKKKDTSDSDAKAVSERKSPRPSKLARRRTHKKRHHLKSDVIGSETRERNTGPLLSELFPSRPSASTSIGFAAPVPGNAATRQREVIHSNGEASSSVSTSMRQPVRCGKRKPKKPKVTVEEAQARDEDGFDLAMDI